MIILDHSTYDGSSITKNFGASEYSYWFVRRAFRPILQRLGVVIPVQNPRQEVDQIHASAQNHGISSLFFSFNPPHLTPVDLACPTIPVFAWEYDTIPDESWHNDPLNDWHHALSQVPAAITHSRFSAAAVRRSLGADYPIWTIPAPMYDANEQYAASAAGWREPFELSLDTGIAIDTATADLSLFSAEFATSQGVRALDRLQQAAMEPDRPPRRLTLSGVIYTTVLNPADGRKNWMDLVAGFVWAFRAEADATLILKVVNRRIIDGVLPILIDLSKLGPFKCRVIVIHGFLSDGDYAKLIDVTSYTVNTARGEGQCLPLMEFMSAGRPAITSRHTAMLDYVTDENTFIVESHQRPTFWAHDVRQASRCLRYEPNFTDLVRRYQESYRVARDVPARYRLMSEAARESQRTFCSNEVVAAGLEQLLGHLAGSRTAKLEHA